MWIRLAARAERPGGFGTCVPGTRKRPHTRRQVRQYHNGTGGLKPQPTTPVLTRPQPQRTKGPRYPTHSTACETQPQDNATSRPPRQHQGHVTCGPGSWTRPHPGGQPAGTAKLARRSSHVAVDSPLATTECTRTPGSPETRIRDHWATLPSTGIFKTLDLDPTTRGTCTPRARCTCGTPPEPPGYTRRGIGPRLSPTRRDADDRPGPPPASDRHSHMDQAVRHTVLW